MEIYMPVIYVITKNNGDDKKNACKLNKNQYNR